MGNAVFMFTDDHVQQLEKKARVKAKRLKVGDERLTDKLTEILQGFITQHVAQQIGHAPSKNVTRLDEICRAAKALRAALPREHVLSDSTLLTLLTAQAQVTAPSDEDGARRLRAARESIDNIYAWTIAAINREAPKIAGGRGGARNTGDKAMRALIGDLRGVWLDYWDLDAGASINQGGVGGPFVRFVLAFCEIPRPQYEGAGYPYHNLAKALSPTPAAIRSRLMFKSKRRKI